MISREKFKKIEEIVLYLFGLSIFLNYKLTKALITIIIVMLIFRKIYFKEKLNCGNEKIKNFLLFYIIFGTFWNFLGGINYKPARSFLKMARYIPFLFFMYPLVENKKKIINNFGICILISYIYFFQNIFCQFISKKYYRVPGFEGINVTSIIGSMMACFTISLFLNTKNILKKIGYLLLFLSSLFVIIATKGRGALVATVVTSIFIIGIYLYKNINFKIISLSILGLIFCIGLGYKILPSQDFNRFKTSFNIQENTNNISNLLRIEMWKNAIWRIEKKPILGYGTKYDPKDTFRVYVKQMPEKTSIQKYIKKIFLKSYDDAHNMYLNAVIDNGIFVISLAIIWFLIPIYLFVKNIKIINNNSLFIGILGGIMSFLIQGLFWPIWRKPDQMYFWVFFTMLCILAFNKDGKEE